MHGLVPRCEVSRKCVELFRTLNGDVFFRKLAEQTADEWLYLYKPKVFNKSLPGVMIRYQLLSTEKERDEFNKSNSNWINGEEMKRYADNKSWVEIENKSNRHYLEETLRELKQDSVRSGKVKSLLSEYSFVKI